MKMMCYCITIYCQCRDRATQTICVVQHEDKCNANCNQHQKTTFSLLRRKCTGINNVGTRSMYSEYLYPGTVPEYSGPFLSGRQSLIGARIGACADLIFFFFHIRKPLAQPFLAQPRHKNRRFLVF